MPMLIASWDLFCLPPIFVMREYMLGAWKPKKPKMNDCERVICCCLQPNAFNWQWKVTYWPAVHEIFPESSHTMHATEDVFKCNIYERLQANGCLSRIYVATIKEFRSLSTCSQKP